MDKKYQIFISSTYEDLKEERESVIKAILDVGHIPVGMEMFSAGDEEQWKLIKKYIDDCDYYIVISAFKYGSMDGYISYTEKEYDYAKSIGIPILGFVIKDETKWDSSKIDIGDQNRIEKLKLFKEKIKTKLVSYWSDKNDLYAKVVMSLVKQFNLNPRVGWVKSTGNNSPEVLNEVSRLSKENSELRGIIESYKISEKKEQVEKIKRVLNILKNNKWSFSFYYQNGKDWENRTEVQLYKLFMTIAPEILIENTTSRCNILVGLMFNPDKKRKVRDEKIIPTNIMSYILADLSVLELIKPSDKRHPVSDKNEYWSLTDFGKEIYKTIREEIMLKKLDDIDQLKSTDDK